MADLAWSIATGLRAGYDLRQVFQAMAVEAPEPAAAACKRLLGELENGVELGPALANWQSAIPSAALGRLVEALQGSSESVILLDLLSEELLREYGSDPAFYPSMRREAEQLGAPVPERVIKIP
jgi:hypothetical protein